METQAVIGPPGTGKTHWLTDTIKDLIASGVPPEEIGALTFTNVAAAEMKKRIGNAFPSSIAGNNLKWIGTIHSISKRLLQIPNDNLFLGKHKAEYAKRYNYTFSGDEKLRSEEIEIREQMLRTLGDWHEMFDSWYRNACEDFAPGYKHFHRRSWGMPDGFNFETQSLYLTRKEEFKQENSLWDFTDLLQGVIRRGLCPPVRYLFCDEAQDNSPLLWDVIKMWGESCQRLSVIGDENQSIYGFLPAGPEHFVGFVENADSRINLTQSHRLPRSITELSEKWIHPYSRIERPFFARDAEGVVKRGYRLNIPDLEEIVRENRRPWGAFILSRTRSQSADDKGWLVNAGIPFATNRGAANPMQTLTGQLIYHLVRLIEGDEVKVENLRKLLEVLPSKGWVRHGMKKKIEGIIREDPGRIWSRHDLIAHIGTADFRDAFNIHDFLVPLKLEPETKAYLRKVLDKFGGRVFLLPPNILVTNIHAVKGMEAWVVIIDPSLTRYPYESLVYTPGEERRVGYTGATRPIEALYIRQPSQENHIHGAYGF